ncbi:MAG TPA: hypothetical protein VMW86_04020 [Dehalococcoidales bacterium]|nr:hypothetical protein [Dehalococcoidales bacterium]
MANWDEKYFVTDLKEKIIEAAWTPTFTDNEAMRLISLDSDVRKGAFYMETAWYWPGKWPGSKGDEGTVKEHVHDYDEAIAYIGTNPDDPYDLCGEVELWVDGKQNILDRSFIAFVPAGTKHCPLKIRKVDRPIFHFTAGMSRSYF